MRMVFLNRFLCVDGMCVFFALPYPCYLVIDMQFLYLHATVAFFSFFFSIVVEISHALL